MNESSQDYERAWTDELYISGSALWCHRPTKSLAELMGEEVELVPF